jgi:isopenicillin-N epimerase
MDGQPPSSELSHHWSLDPEITLLNHGSFGACPRAVLARQQELRERMEARPVQFFQREFDEPLNAARVALAEFVGSDDEDIGLVSNVTNAINCVLRSLKFEPGDELLTTNHTYGAMKNVLQFVAERAGAKVVAADVPFPLKSSEQVTQAILNSVTEHTRIALIDHVASNSALVFPIREIVEKLSERGVDTLVDGAHAAGNIPLDLRAINAAYYAGNCHKWICTPKGAGFIRVRKDKQAGIYPSIISFGYAGSVDGTGFHNAFMRRGTDDPSPLMCIPDTLKAMAALKPGGWPEIMSTNRNLALDARRVICERLGTELPCPDEMVCALASIAFKVNDQSREAPIGTILLERWSIEVPILRWRNDGQNAVRISAQLYNTLEQYKYLAEALSEFVME